MIDGQSARGVQMDTDKAAEQDNPTASKHPQDNGIERWPSVNTSTSEAMMNSQMSKSKEFHEVVSKHPSGELGNTEVNLLRNLIKVNKAYAQQLEQTIAQQESKIKELTEQLKQKG